MNHEPSPARIVETDVPARLDRLPWAGFHWLVVVALGITWILDGLEVTLAGSVAPALRESPTLRFTASDVGLANSAYLAGAVLGALFFGWLTDRMGRKKLFTITLLIYLSATAGTALTWDLPSFALMRFLTGAGIGGEYSAINSGHHRPRDHFPAPPPARKPSMADHARPCRTGRSDRGGH